MSEILLREDLEDGICQLTLNRPERRNALSTELLLAIIEGLEAAKADDSVRVVILTGAGEKAFCAGGDLSPKGMMGGFLGMHYGREAFVELFRTMRELGKPLIARVQGHCLGGGFGLMLGCDMAIASDNATFGTPEIKVGLFPMMIMTVIFRNLGRKRGMELIFSGERISAEKAADWAILNQVVPREELDEAVLTMARKVASFSPAVLRLGRDAFYTQEDMPFEQALRYLHSQLTLNTMCEDAAEGIAAFMTKRPPKWKGR